MDIKIGDIVKIGGRDDEHFRILSINTEYESFWATSLENEGASEWKIYQIQEVIPPGIEIDF